MLLENGDRRSQTSVLTLNIGALALKLLAATRHDRKPIANRRDYGSKIHSCTPLKAWNCHAAFVPRESTTAALKGARFRRQRGTRWYRRTTDREHRTQPWTSLPKQNRRDPSGDQHRPAASRWRAPRDAREVEETELIRKPRKLNRSATDRLIALVESELKKQGVSGQEVAREARLPADAFRALRRGFRPTLDRAEEMLKALGASMMIGAEQPAPDPNGSTD